MYFEDISSLNFSFRNKLQNDWEVVEKRKAMWSSVIIKTWQAAITLIST